MRYFSYICSMITYLTFSLLARERTEGGECAEETFQDRRIPAVQVHGGTRHGGTAGVFRFAWR